MVTLFVQIWKSACRILTSIVYKVVRFFCKRVVFISVFYVKSILRLCVWLLLACLYMVMISKSQKFIFVHEEYVSEGNVIVIVYLIFSQLKSHCSM